MKVGQRKITQIADVFDVAIRKNHRSAHYAQAFDRGECAWIQAVGNSPEEFRQYMLADLVKWAKLVKESGAKLD